MSSAEDLKEPQALSPDLSEVRMISIGDAEKILRVSKTTMYGLLARSQDPVPSVRIGRSRRIPFAKFKWWMEKLQK